MKNLFKILTLIFTFIGANAFAQTRRVVSMETGYWNFQMNQYETDSYSMNRTQTILVHKTDSVWVELDSIWRHLKYRYKVGHNFETVNSAISNERYYVYATDSTFEVADMNLHNTNNKFCFIQISVSKDMVYKITEFYNANCGLYYMAGDKYEIICKLMTLLKKVSSPG